MRLQRERERESRKVFLTLAAYVMGLQGIFKRIFDNDGRGPGLNPALAASVPIAYPGEIRLLPFPPDELPDDWYLPNGDLTSVDSGPGKVLVSMSPAYKSLWGLTVQNGQIPLPNVFDASGQGYFFRAVDGTSRVVGSKQGDAIRNIVGKSKLRPTGVKAEQDTGPFASTVDYPNQSTNGVNNSSYDWLLMDFDASRCVPTANENRPNNLGFTPGIFLRRDNA
jgi:hypothetical protein